MRRSTFAGVLAVLLGAMSGRGQAAEPVKIGFVTELTGPSGIIGDEMVNGFKLALSETGDTLGGRQAQVIYADTQAKPDIARQIADKMIENDHVQIITGLNLSNMLLAIAKPVLDAGVFLISNNAGPSLLAGKQCAPHFFSVSHQNDTLYEALGIYMQKKGVKNSYLLAPNYAAGKDMLTGFKRTYKGGLVGETYTPLNALDYAATITEVRAKQPQSVLIFYPGGMGINFVKQYAQSGMEKDVPLYTGPGAVDQTTFGAIGDSALGIVSVVNWTEGLDVPASRKFVASFTKAYGRPPSPFAAFAYDTARLIDAAATSIGGKIEDKPAFQKALETVKFESIRGPFRFNTNHFPIQSFYSTVVERNAEGRLYPKLTGTVVSDLKDSYAAECEMGR